MAGDVKGTVVVDLDLVLGELDDDQLIKQLGKMGDAVASSVAKVSINPDVKVDAQKMLDKVNQQLLTAAPKTEDADKVVATYRKFFKDIGTALSAVGADLPAEQARLLRDRFNKIAADDRDALSRLDAEQKAEAIRFVKASEGRDNLIRQALKSSESIRNDTGGKERDPLLPLITPETKRQLDENLATYRKFYKAIGDTAEAARIKEEQNQVYRRQLLDPFLLQGKSPKNLGEGFSFAGTRRAIAGEIRRLNQDLDRAAPSDRKLIQDEVDKLEKLRRDLGNRFRELFGSTLGRGLESSKGQRDEALGEYFNRIGQYQNPELDRETRLAALSSAKKELTRSLTTAYAAQRATQDPKEKEDARLNVLGLEKRMRMLTNILDIEREQGAELRRNTKEEKDRVKWADDKAAAEARALAAMRQMAQMPVGSRGYVRAKAEATDAAGTVRTLAKKLGEQSPGSLAADVRFLAKQLGDSEKAAGRATSKKDEQTLLNATLKRAGDQANAALESLKRVEFGSIEFEKQLARARSAAGEYTSAAKKLGRENPMDFRAYVDSQLKMVLQQARARSKVIPAEDFNAHVGVYQTRQTRIEAAGRRMEDLTSQVSSLRSLMGNAQTEDRIRTLRVLLAEALSDVRGLNTESKKLGFEEGIGSALRLKKEISEIGKNANDMLKEIKGPTPAQARQAERDRIRQAMIARGEAAFQEAGGLTNYAQIPKHQREAAKEYAQSLRPDIRRQMADVQENPNLSLWDKNRAIRGLEKDFKLATRAATYLQQEISGNVGALRQLQLSARNFARYFLFYGGMYQIIGYFTQLARSIVQFQDSLKQTQVVAQATTREMGNIGEAVRSVAADSGNSLQEVATAAETLAQAGTSVKDIPAALKAVSDFALATGSSLQVAADIITSAKEIFGENLTFTGAADQLTRAVNISKLKAEDLRTIFNLGAQTAQASGLSSAQFLGASATLSNLGIKSSTVATGLRQLLLELFNPDEKTIAFLRKRYNELGERLSDGEIKSRFQGFQSSNNPLLAALGELRRIGAAGSGRDEFRRVLDIRAENVALPLLQRLDELSKSVTQISATGAAAAGASDRVETLWKAVQQLGVKAQLLAEQLAGGLPKDLENLAKAIGNFIDRLRGYDLTLAAKGESSSIDKGTTVAGGVLGYLAARTRLGRVGSAVAGAVTGAATYLGGKATEGGDSATGEKVSAVAEAAATAWASWALISKVFSKLGGLFGKRVTPAVAKVEEGLAGISLAAEETAASAGILERLALFIAKFHPIIRIGAWAATAYAAFEALQKVFDKQADGAKDPSKVADALTGQQEAINKVLATQQQELGQAEQALEQLSEKSRDSVLSQAKEVEGQVSSYNTLLTEIFGRNADDAAKLLEELGSVPLEAGTKRTKEMRARLEAKAPKGIDEQKFMALSKARADFTAAQGSLTALAEQQLNKAAQIVREGQANMDETEKSFLAAVDELRDSPLFKPGAFSPENMVQSLKDLYRLMQFDIDQKTKQLKDAQAAVGNTQAQQTSLDLRQAYGEGGTPDTRKQFDIFIQQARQNPTQEGLAQLQRIKAETAKYLQEQIAAAPKDAPIPQDMADRITNLEDVQKKVDEAIKVSSDALTTADERKKKAEADAAEQKKIDEAKEKARIAEEEAAAISAEQVEVAKKALEVDKDEYDAKVKLAQKEGRWEELLKPGGLIDQQYAARVKVAEMEQQLAAQELRKAADAAGLTLPRGFTELKDPKDRVAVKRVEGGTDKLSKLDQANVNLASIKKTRDEVKASMLEASKQVVPFTESEAYNNRQIEIRKLKEKINDSEKEGLSEMLAMVDKLYQLEIANIQEEIDHIKSQKGNYGSSEKEQAKYRIDLAKAEDKKAEAISQLKQQRQAIIDRSEKQALDAEKKSIEAQQKLIREQNKRIAQAPETTRRGVQVLTGVPPQMGGVSAVGISQNAQIAYDYFTRKGLKPYQAAGLVGNLMQESSPDVVPGGPVNKEGGRGIAQWKDTRRTDLEAFAARNQRNVEDLQTQLDFMWSELQGPEKRAFRRLRGTANVSQAAAEVSGSYERPGAPMVENRIRYAQQVLAAMQGSGAAYGYRPTPSTLYAGQPSWDFPSNVRVGNGTRGDIIGQDKFRQNAPEVWQAIIGGAMKWQQEGGKVVIREMGRAGGKPNHRNGYAADVQLIDKNGREIPNIRADGKDFRAYEKFWQDGLAYAMQYYPGADKYFRHGGYFMYDTGRDSMHSDVTKKYLPKTPDGAGGNLTTGANPLMRAAFPKLVSQGIPGGDWNAYFQQRFPEMAGRVPAAAPDNTNQYLNVLSGLNFAGTETANVIESNSRRLQELDLQWIENARKRSLKDPNVDLKAEVDALVAKTYEDVTKSQQRKVDSLRSGLEAQQSYVTLKQSEMLPLGPEVAAARTTAGLAMAPADELTRLKTVKDELDKVSLASEEALYASEEMRKKLTEQKGLTEDTLASLNSQLQQAQQQGDTGKAGELGAKITYYEAYLSAVTDGLKGWDTISAEFMTRINEANAAIATNAQEQQNVNPSLLNREVPIVGPDGKPTGRTTTQYGQLAQGFDAKAIAGELNDLAYSLKNLGKNIRGFIVGAVDTFVSTVADKLVRGAEKVDTTALNQARADLYQAQGDASYNLAQQRKDLAAAEATANQMPGNAGAQARRAEMQSAYAESSRAYGEAVNARQQQVRELEQQQQGQGIGGALQEAFTALSQEFASTMLKTILMSPFQAVFDKLGFGQRGSSAANPIYTKDVDAANKALPGADSKGGGVLGSEKGGVIDSVLGPIEDLFSGIKGVFSGLFSTIAGWMGSLGGGGSGGSWVSSLLSMVGMAFADGGHVKGPGTGTSDSIPAWLSNGEYVLTKKEVDAIGVQNIEKWKAAMASPAKFAKGGLVQTFDSTARNTANYSNAGATGGSTDVTIIDQRSQATSEPVSVSRTRGPDNKEVIQVMVRDAVKNAINSGMMDRTMRANYGARRTGAR